MLKLKAFTIAGFRGIRQPLSLPVEKSGKPVSLLIYGRNGTGKSSIADAWEWLTSGKVQHLAREGAAEASYPHKAAMTPGETYVTAHFTDPRFTEVKLEFDFARKSQPKPSSNLTALRQELRHPSHLRYADLTRFVLMTKGERFDELAGLMGFASQMQYLKSLRRVEAQVKAAVEQAKSAVMETTAQLRLQFGQGATLPQSIAHMAERCKEHGYPPSEQSLEAVRVASSELSGAIAADPTLIKLGLIQPIQIAARVSLISSSLAAHVSTYRQVLGSMKVEQAQQAHAQHQVSLFEAAQALLKVTEDASNCPICKRPFEGDLLEHVSGELARLRHIQQLRTELSSAKARLNQAMGLLPSQLLSPISADSLLQLGLDGDEWKNLKDAVSETESAISVVRAILQRETTTITDEDILDAQSAESQTIQSCLALTAAQDAFAAIVDTKAASLKQSKAQEKRVSDAKFVANGLNLIDELFKRRMVNAAWDSVLSEFQPAVDDFSQKSVESVGERFEEISAKVKSLFALLEKDTEGIGEPKLKLVPTQDRAVVLEVMFHGETISPAYKYLSESQLNSFGLAVFIASALHFNEQCGVMILDDIVNSFDAHKRPRLVQLIKEHLANHQVILLTHDRLFQDQVLNSFPNWNRLDFFAYSFNSGPNTRISRTRL
jgi:DNA repair exonuclease SbcCD ATPase subunit